jgi:DNA polymerase I-like protein with 3'-5' exonuclease and polymerase domains
MFLGKSYTLKIWRNERLSSFISFDTETTFIDFNDRSATPDLIVGQAFDGADTVYLLNNSNIKRFFNANSRSTFIMHNAAFDMNVIRPHIGDDLFFEVYDENRLHDTSILFRLLKLAIEGEIPFKYNLALLSKIFLGIDLDKNEDIRLTFGDYAGKSLNEIPLDHLSYASIDAIATYQIYYKMLPHIKNHDKFGTMLSQDIQVKGEIALRSIEKNGIGFDLAARDEWLAKQDIDLSLLSEKISGWGYVRGMKGNTLAFERILKFLGIYDSLPLTETGQVSMASDDLKPYIEFEFIKDYLRFMEIEKATSFVRDISSNRVHSRYTSILNTGRTSASGPNIMQLPRVGGIREMFIPDPGNVFIDVDYSAIELSTLAQVLVDKYEFSVMADKVNDGIDLHKYYAGVLFNKNPSNVTKEERQKAKAANFGFPRRSGHRNF